MQPIPASTADVHAPSSNTAAVVTYAAVSDRRHALGGVAWSYSAAPTGGSLKIEDGSGNVVFGPHAITSAGPGVIYFTPPKLEFLKSTGRNFLRKSEPKWEIASLSANRNFLPLLVKF